MPNRKNSRNILLVAEQDDHADRCRHRLESMFRVIPAINARDGLNAFLQEEIHSVVIDSNISGIGGISLFQKIRHVASHIPIYYVCNRISSEDLEACASLGINGFFKKPVDPLELVAKIDGDMGQRVPDNLATLLKMEYPSGANELHPKIQLALKIIHDNYFRPFNKGLLLDRLQISSEYLSRLFRRDCGMTIPQYIGRLRVEKAKALLVNTSISTGKIAGMIGFQNANYFYILFRELTGSSPGELRKNQGISNIFPKKNKMSEK